MEQHETISVSKGIWIDEQHLADAGLGDQVAITVRPGEIRIVTAPREASGRPEDGWEVFRSLGRQAQEGQLANPSTDHDRYLYGQNR